MGGGPAGLTTALYLARFLRRVTVIDAEDGRALMIPKTHNLGPFPEGVSGPDLLARMLRHAVHYGASFETGLVSHVEKQGDNFLIATEKKVIAARCVVFATGVFNHRPPLSPSDHDRGLAKGLIRYCPICDCYEARDKRIAVLASGEGGVHEAQFISHYTSSVTLIPFDGVQVVARKGVGVLATPLKRVDISDSDVIVTLENDDEHHFDTLYVALGTTPRAELADRLGIELSGGGHVKVDANHNTSMDRVYAVGDLVEGLDQIAVAIGQGTTAATSIHHKLLQLIP